MDEPKISVIVPIFNAEAYLMRCFESLKNQIYRNLEIILVDDGSVDNTNRLCSWFAEQYPNVNNIRQENQGLSGARNSGIKAATGVYLTFFDADDELEPDYISYLYQLARSSYAEIAVCALQEIYEPPATSITITDASALKRDGKNMKKLPRPVNFGLGYQPELMAQETALKRLLCEEGFNVAAYAKLYRTELWQGVEFPVGRINEDLGTTYKLFLRASKIAYGPEPKYHYMKHDGSLSRQPYSDQKMDIILLTDQMCDDIDNSCKNLQNATNLRRAHARFSVLGQMAEAASLTPEQLVTQKELIKWLKEHKDWVAKNPLATQRDKSALSAVNLGAGFFKMAWKMKK